MNTRLAVVLVFVLFPLIGVGAEVQWKQLSSKHGDLPVPGPSTEQTSAVVADLDRDGVNDFVLSFRKVAPALVWFRHAQNGWERYVVEKDFLTVEAGGAVWDIDRDGDLDLVFGTDWQGNSVWWWENPYPKFEREVSWKRHVIKKEGARQHHDQLIADLMGLGIPQFIFWNQGAKTLYLAEIPKNAREIDVWPYRAIFSGKAGEGVQSAARYAEGLGSCDVDGDGKVDLLAGNYWFKHEAGKKFVPTKVGKMGGCIVGGRLLKNSRCAQIVISPGDGVGPLTWHECLGDPGQEASWKAHALLPKVVHGHSLQLGDVDADGNLDIFCAEMAKWGAQAKPDHPEAKAWIFYGDGKGNFKETVLVTGHGWHEARLADLDGDGDLDLLNKPYTWEAPRVDVWLNPRIMKTP